MTTDLEELITAALRNDAQRAPQPSPGGFRPSAPACTSSVARGRWARSLSLIAAAVVVALVSWRTGRPDVAVVQEAWTPEGREFPLRDLGPASTSLGVTLAEVGRTIGVEDHPNIVVTEELWPNVWPVDSETSSSGPWEMMGTTSTVFRCTSSSGAGCGPSWLDDVPNVSQTSSVDNGAADFDLWIWSNVPADAAFVSFTTADGDERWQRPVAGVASFPVEGGPSQDATVTTYDDDGNTVSTMDDWPDTDTPDPPATSIVLTARQADTLTELNNRVLFDCLTAAGAVFEPVDDSASVLGSRLGTIEDPVLDPNVIWDSCVHTTQRSVETFAAYLDDVNTTTAATAPDG